MSLDIGPALRSAILDQQNPALQAVAASIVAGLQSYLGEPAVFAYRPIPDDAPDRVIIINTDASLTDQDGLRSDRPVIQRDIIAYGRRGTPGQDDSAIIESIGYWLRELFHRQKFSVQFDGYSVIDIVATGPVAAPVDDETEVARVVSLTIRLRRS